MLNGKERKEAGMELVATSGDEELKAEKEAYRAAAYAWVVKITGPVVFNVEDLRRDLGDPPGDPNNMGSLTGHLKRKKLIKSVGRKHAERKQSNDCWIDLYVRTEFYDDYLTGQLDEAAAARLVLEEHNVSLLDAAKLAADILSLPLSTRQKIATFFSK
jgi:hypothetical protein